MSTHDEIDKAISAHGMWKHKLRKAIDCGVCDSTPDRVTMDNNCAFGKWLHERIDAHDKGSSYYSEIVDLHAQFHREAGAILGLVLEGDNAAASSRMTLTSTFSTLSGNLTRTMKAWQTTL
ncbi:MAG: CZB domain-containing protein [Gammaproteobacteria bacterium]|nr:CZB domain-containing protein [Gammaproteobacteria bacterium]